MAKYGDMVIVSDDVPIEDLDSVRTIVREQAGRTWAALGCPDVRNFKFLESQSDLGCTGLWDDDDLDIEGGPQPAHGNRPHLHMGWTFET